MLQACKMEGFPLVPPVSTGTPPPAQPVALGRPPASPQAALPACYQWEVGVSSLELWPENQRGAIGSSEHALAAEAGPVWGCDRWGLNGYL